MKPEQTRVEKALAWAQKILGTSYTLMVEPIPAGERDDHAGILMMVGRTHRGADDANAFSVVYNPDEVRGMSTTNLRVAAGHELIHCILQPLAELAEERGSKERRARAREANETATYILMRAIFGEMR